MACDSSADLARELSLKVAYPGHDGTGLATSAAVFEWTIYAPHSTESEGTALLRRAVQLARRIVPVFAPLSRWLTRPSPVIR